MGHDYIAIRPKSVSEYSELDKPQYLKAFDLDESARDWGADKESGINAVHYNLSGNSHLLEILGVPKHPNVSRLFLQKDTISQEEKENIERQWIEWEVRANLVEKELGGWPGGFNNGKRLKAATCRKIADRLEAWLQIYPFEPDNEAEEANGWISFVDVCFWRYCGGCRHW